MKVLTKVLLLLPLLAAIFFYTPLTAQATFNSNYVISDKAFENSGVWSTSQIDSFMNGFGPSCTSLSNGFTTSDPQGWSDAQGKYAFGGSVSGGQAIYDTAQLYHLSPQVILSTMQKEQSLISGSQGCHPNTPDPATATPMTDACGSGTRNCTTACPYSGGCMTIAMGYGCPNYCNANDEGFSMQLTLGSWLLRFGEQRSYGVLSGYTGYETGDQNFCYSGPMTPGYRARSASATACGGTADNVATYYDGTWTSSNGISLNITNGGTASLYNFTPYTTGNSNFYSIYSSWFGSPTSPCFNDNNLSGVITGEHILANSLANHTDSLSLVMPNNTGTACVETHTWLNGSNYQTWLQHIGSVSPAIDPTASKILTLDGNGDGVDELALVVYNGHSGMIEVHGWNPDLQNWVYHIATNHPGVSAADDEVIAADLDGSGHDSLFLVQYRNTASGHVEIHEWSRNLQQWVNHWDTGIGTVDPKASQIIAADLNGDGRDELYLVDYSGTQSGRIELHGGFTNLPYLTNWPYSNPVTWPVHTATISGAVTHVDASGNSVADIVAADTNGDGRDEIYLVQYTGTQSSRVEVHGMTANQQQWVSHIATSAGAF